MKRRSRRSYTNEFKELLVQLYLHGKPSSEIVSEYDLITAVFYRWIRQYKNNGACSLKNELENLRAECKQLRVENEILRQAAIVTGRSKGV